MSTPKEWFEHARRALLRELGKDPDEPLYSKVPQWTAEDEIHLAQRVVAMQEQALVKDALDIVEAHRARGPHRAGHR